MSTTVNIHEAETHLSRLLERVLNGERIIIAKGGKPIAVLSPVSEPVRDRVPGIDAGKIIIHDNFDDPLPEFDDLRI
jgi:prevent-host-death family protein